MSAADVPFDRGLQAERTLLSWKRMSLSLVVASAVLTRLTIESWGAPAVLIGVLGVAMALFGYFGATKRYRRAHASLLSGAGLVMGGWPIAAVAGAGVLVAAAGVVYVLL